MMTKVFRWTENGNEIFESDLDHIPDICYHLTPNKNVDSILKNGLVPGSPHSTLEGKHLGKSRVYLCAHPNLLDYDAVSDFKNMTLLKVDVSLLKHLMKPDAEWRSSDHENPMHSEEDTAWYLEDVIDVEFISL